MSNTIVEYQSKKRTLFHSKYTWNNTQNDQNGQMDVSVGPNHGAVDQPPLSTHLTSLLRSLSLRRRTYMSIHPHTNTTSFIGSIPSILKPVTCCSTQWQFLNSHFSSSSPVQHTHPVSVVTTQSCFLCHRIIIPRRKPWLIAGIRRRGVWGLVQQTHEGVTSR